MKYLSFIALVLYGCSVSTQNPVESISAADIDLEIPEKIEKIKKSDKEWRAELSEMEYHVLRKAGTERAFSGNLWDNKKNGIYVCGGCSLPLFDSNTKYRSGTGWPSFYEPIAKHLIGEDTDYKIGYARTEVHCARCGGHLGHVFPDGPEPTGLRYCINSVSLGFVETPEIKEVEK